MLGQTVFVTARHPAAGRFNGGPSNCSAKPLAVPHSQARCRYASMEGRAIARPNPHEQSQTCGPGWLLQWRAEQLLGQTGLSLRLLIHRLNLLQWRAEQLLGQT